MWADLVRLFPKLFEYVLKHNERETNCWAFWIQWYFVTKIVLTYYEKKYSSDREKVLKFKAEGREVAKQNLWDH